MADISKVERKNGVRYKVRRPIGKKEDGTYEYTTKSFHKRKDPYFGRIVRDKNGHSDQ